MRCTRTSIACPGKSLGWLSPALLIWALGFSGWAQVIRVPEQVEVASDSLVLGDIAQLDDEAIDWASIPIGYAPYPGHYRWLKRSDLRSYLKRWGVDASQVTVNMKDQVLITRASQTVPREKLMLAVESFLESQRPELEFHIRRIDLPNDVVLPKGNISVRVNSRAPLTNLALAHLKLDFFVENHYQTSQWTRVALLARGPALVTTRQLPYGHRLQASDLVVREEEFSRLDDFLSVPDEVIGQVAKRTLQAGAILRRKDIQQPTLVKPGQVVKVVVRGKTFLVSTVGRARSGGAIGDLIQIQNPQSRRVFDAVVVGEKQVRVELLTAIR